MCPAEPGPNVLVVEDDPKTASLVCLYLEREGFRCTPVADGRAALETFRAHSPDFVILDLMLPEVDGWQICREIRRSSQVPLLILSAREEEMDRVLGFSLGADDYVVKPFSPRELVARVQAILRRSAGRGNDEALRQGELVLDRRKKAVTLKGRRLSLTPAEYVLLETLMKEPGRTFERSDLVRALYPNGEAVIDRVVDVRIGKLRQRLGDDPAKPRFIQTVRGFGYRLLEDDERARGRR